MFLSKRNQLLIITLIVFKSVICQTGFGHQQVVGLSTGARALHSSDINNDGLLDIIAHSSDLNKVSWYMNDSTGLFNAKYPVSNDNVGVWALRTADIDNNGDMDVIVGTNEDIRWYRNIGDGVFAEADIITTNVDNVYSLDVNDLNNDSYMDVIYTSWYDEMVAFNLNQGNGSFGPQTIITEDAWGAAHVRVVDLDNDAILDVLYSSFSDGNISWNKNNGNAVFGEKQVIASEQDNPICTFSADLDNDGDNDVLSVFQLSKSITWHENDGYGNFVNTQTILTSSYYTRYVYADDLDNDGLIDIISADTYNIYYSRNLGNGNFAEAIIITDQVEMPREIMAIDLDNDGDKDILSASQYDYKIAYYENNYNYFDKIYLEMCENDSLFIIDDWIKVAGNYYDSLTTVYGGDSILNYEVIVNPLPDTFSISGPEEVGKYDIHLYTIPNDSVTSCYWEVQNGNIIEYPSDSSVRIHWENIGIGSVKSTTFYNNTGCASQDSMIVTIGELGVVEESTNEIYVYPNPASEYIFINHSYKHHSIEVYNSAMISVRKTRNRKVNVSNLPNGYYFVILKNELNKVIWMDKIIINSQIRY